MNVLSINKQLQTIPNIAYIWTYNVVFILDYDYSFWTCHIWWRSVHWTPWYHTCGNILYWWKEAILFFNHANIWQPLSRVTSQSIFQPGLCIYCILAHTLSSGWRTTPFVSNVISKSVITQCKICLARSPTPTFILISLETLCAYTREDTVFILLLACTGKIAGYIKNIILAK